MMGYASFATWIEALVSDYRFAARQLRKSPGFTAAAVFTLALGIGATTAIFSVINGALLRPYPYKNADRLATFRVFAADQFRAWRFTASAYVDFKEQNHTFEDMFGWVYREIRFARPEGTEELFGGSVTPEAFESLGIPPLLGRALTAEDAKPGASPVFVINYRLWIRLFQRDPNILGTIHTLNGSPMTLVGIMPPRFQFGGSDLWLPLSVNRNSFLPGTGIESNEVWTVGHLKPGVNPETAAADLQQIAAPHQSVDPIYFPPDFRIVVNTLNRDAVGRDFKFGLFALMTAVSILLLIACSNVANLLLARATTREGEFGIRSALGASRFQLIRQLLVESFSLALAACLVGCLFAYLGLNAIMAVIPTDSIPQEAAITLSPAALFFSLGATIVTTLICGLAPALYALRADSQLALARAGKGLRMGSSHGRLGDVLVIAEVALAIVLAIGSGLLLRSLFALQNVNLGFNPSKVVYAQIAWPEGTYDSAQQKHLFLRKVLDRLAQFPGVVAATAASSYPPYTWGWTTAVIAGQDPPKNRNTAFVWCTESYFQTLDRPLLRGDLFTRNDVDSSRHVLIVNQTFAREHFGEANPIGQRVRFSDFETLSDWPHDPYFEIVGVVGDAKNTGLQDLPRPEIYLPAALTGAGTHNLMIRTTAYPAALLKQVRLEISAADSNVAVGETGTISTILQNYYYARPRFLLIILCTIATIAVVLVALGVFSVISYTVAMRTQEIGIRSALGAHGGQILYLVVKKGMRLVVAGTAGGLLASYFLTRLLANQIWGVSPTDAPTFVAAAVLALCIGVLACLIPARRASRVNPLVALRYE